MALSRSSAPLRRDPPAEPTAALRDASWFARPNVTSLKRYHIVVIPESEGVRFATSWEAACGRPLAEFTGVPVDDVAATLRCQASGCRQRWPQ